MEHAEASERIIHQVRHSLRQHLDSSFIGLIAQGSAVKGGFIQGCSDIDFIVYVEDSALNDAKKLPIDLCIKIHKSLSAIDPAPFRYIQFSVISLLTNSYLGPIRGSYRLVAGRLLIPEATDEQLYLDAVKALSKLNPAAAFDAHRLMDHGEGRLERSTRIMCTIVWPVLFQLLTVIHKDGIRIWNLTKQEAISRLAAVSGAGEKIQSFYELLLAYYPQENSVEQALRIIHQGVSFLDAAKKLWTDSLSIEVG